MRTIGGWILAALKAADDEATPSRIAGEVAALCQHFPVPADRECAA